MLLDVVTTASLPFHTLNAEFRRRVTEEEEEASGADLVFTFVWGMDTPEEAGYLERLVAP